MESSRRYKKLLCNSHEFTLFVKETLLQLRYEHGFIVAEYGSDNKNVVKVEFGSVADGQWHYVATAVKSKVVRLDVDDLYSNEVQRTVTVSELLLCHGFVFHLFEPYHCVHLLEKTMFLSTFSIKVILLNQYEFRHYF